ncbi:MULTISPECIES: cytochrome c [unclassified Bradyrhizobium]|nr:MULTISPECIES: cytochrome c [unclassified Bradyrhizobium]
MSWLRAIFGSFGILVFGAATWTASAQRPASPPSASLGRALAETHCASCHGIDDNSADPQHPKLAGQRASYIRQQLRAFRNGERRSDIMSGPAASLTEAQIRELAAYFSP